MAEQLGEALRGLALVLDGELEVERALAMVHNLQARDERKSTARAA